MSISNVKAPVVQSRLFNQASRIQQGVQSGSLTTDEAKALASQQKDFYKDVFEAKQSNGSINPYERSQLRQELRQASRDIYLAKHNDVAL